MNELPSHQSIEEPDSRIRTVIKTFGMWARDYAEEKTGYDPGLLIPMLHVYRNLAEAGLRHALSRRSESPDTKPPETDLFPPTDTIYLLEVFK